MQGIPEISFSLQFVSYLISVFELENLNNWIGKEKSVHL